MGKPVDPETYNHELESMLVDDPVAPVAPDLGLKHSLQVQHLGIEIANKAIEMARLQGAVDLVVIAYRDLNIDTWSRQTVHEPRMSDGEPLTMPGPVVIPPSEHEALSRFLSAVEGLQ